MATFAIAYLLIWLAVTVYVARMAHCQHRLGRKIESLHRQLESQETQPPRISKAA